MAQYGFGPAASASVALHRTELNWVQLRAAQSCNRGRERMLAAAGSARLEAVTGECWALTDSSAQQKYKQIAVN